MSNLQAPNHDAQRHYDKLNQQYERLREERATLEQALHRARDRIRKLKRGNSILIDVMRTKYPGIGNSDDGLSDDDDSSTQDGFISSRAHESSSPVPHTSRNERHTIIKWDDRLSEQRRTSRESSTSSLYSIPQTTTSTIPEKRRRRTGKRDDRTQPKAVQPLPRRPDGTIALPVTIGRGTNEVIIYNIGSVVCDREGFHNPRYIWPVGFKSKKYLPSLTTPSKKTGYISEILDGGNAPIFQVTPEDSPSTVFSGASASGVWKQLLDQIASLGVTAKTHASGPEMLGLSNLAVTKAIQELPDADKCTRYVPQRWLDQSQDQYQDQDNDASSPHESSSLYIVHEQPTLLDGSDRSL